MANALAEEIRQLATQFKGHGRKQSDAMELCEAALADLAIAIEISRATTSDEYEEWRYGAREFADKFNSIQVATAKGA